MSGTYARETNVSAEKSRGEIERTLGRYGATAFGYGWNAAGAIVSFEAHDRRIQFTLTMPDRNDPEFTRHADGVKLRSVGAAERLYEQATRQRWRALALIVKAKLEAVAIGVSTFEEEFLAYTIVPGPHGRPVTLAEVLLPQVAEAYEKGLPLGGLMLALPSGDQS